MGHAGCGKDSVAEYLSRKYNFRIVSFYEPLRNLAKDLFDREDRQTLRRLGRALSDAFGRDIFISYWSSNFPHGNVVLKDARYRNELVWLSEVCELIIAVKCDPGVSAERIKRRAREGDPADEKELLSEWNQESDLDDDYPRFHSVDNSADFQTTAKEVDKLVNVALGEKGGQSN